MNPIPVFPTILFLALCITVFYYLIITFRQGLQTATPLQRRLPLFVLIGILTIQSIIAYTGGLWTETLPPRLLQVALPSILLAVFISLLYKPVAGHSLRFSRSAVLYLQTFRLPLELLFLWFYTDGLMPLQMTFEGRNPDVLIGLTAPLIAYWGVQQKKLPNWVMIAWNFFGLATLLNIVTIAVLSAPGPLRFFMNEPANTLVLQFPFHWIPTFLVPVALFLHLFSLKQHFSLVRAGRASSKATLAA